MTPAAPLKSPAKPHSRQLLIVLGILTLGLITDASLLVAAVVVH